MNEFQKALLIWTLRGVVLGVATMQSVLVVSLGAKIICGAVAAAIIYAIIHDINNLDGGTPA